jgi:hypothetical protein
MARVGAEQFVGCAMTNLPSYIIAGAIAAFGANALQVNLQGTGGPLYEHPVHSDLVPDVNRAGKGDRLPLATSVVGKNTAATSVVEKNTAPPLTIRDVKEGCDPAISPLAGASVRADIGLRCLS